MTFRADQIQQRMADIGLATSAGGSAYAWLGTATDIMQFVVLVVSAIAGLASAYYYITKARREHEQNKSKD